MVSHGQDFVEEQDADEIGMPTIWRLPKRPYCQIDQVMRLVDLNEENKQNLRTYQTHANKEVGSETQLNLPVSSEHPTKFSTDTMFRLTSKPTQNHTETIDLDAGVAHSD